MSVALFLLLSRLFICIVYRASIEMQDMERARPMPASKLCNKPFLINHMRASLTASFLCQIRIILTQQHRRVTRPTGKSDG